MVVMSLFRLLNWHGWGHNFILDPFARPGFADESFHGQNSFP